MAHGGAAPNPHVQHRNPPPLPVDPRRQLDLGMKLIARAFACRESEILQLRHQAADKDRKIAHLDLTLNQANARFRGALEQNAMLLKKWDARYAMLKQWGLSSLKDIGVSRDCRVAEFSKLPAEVAGLKESLIADGKNERDDDDEEEVDGLSKSGKDMKKLLGKSARLIETGGPAATNDDGPPESSVGDDDDDDDEDENNMSPVLAPKKIDTPKDKHGDNTPAKSASFGPTGGTPSSSKSSKSKRKAESEDAKTANGPPAKMVKSDNEPKISVKDEIPISSKPTATPKASSLPSSKIEQTPSNAPVTEAEIRSTLLQKAPMTTQDLVAIFKPRLKSQKDKAAFAEILRKISKIQKFNGQNYVVLGEKQKSLYLLHTS